jgi:hypothetical protein
MIKYKAHTVSLLNIPIFTFVSKASTIDIDTLIPYIKKVVLFNEFTDFDLLADKGYDSIKNDDFIHNSLNSKVYIPLRKSSVKPATGECGKSLVLHSKYFDKSRDNFR